MGGVYERLVGVVKRALRKSIGNHCLSQDQLTMLLCEAEPVVNSHPLVYVGEEIDSGCMITPSHFLSVRWNTVFPAFQNSTCSKKMRKIIQIFSLAFLPLLCYYKHGRKAKRYRTASGSRGDKTTSSVFESGPA